MSSSGEAPGRIPLHLPEGIAEEEGSSANCEALQTILPASSATEKEALRTVFPTSPCKRRSEAKRGIGEYLSASSRGNSRGRKKQCQLRSTANSSSCFLRNRRRSTGDSSSYFSPQETEAKQKEALGSIPLHLPEGIAAEEGSSANVCSAPKEMDTGGNSPNNRLSTINYHIAFDTAAGKTGHGCYFEHSF